MLLRDKVLTLLVCKLEVSDPLVKLFILGREDFLLLNLCFLFIRSPSPPLPLSLSRARALPLP